MFDISTTVVIPVYNGTEHVGRALTSIAQQQIPVDEIIVVDDGSTDSLADVLRAMKFDGTYICQSNQGQGAATNRGIIASSTSHILFLDHDDEWPKDRLLWQRKTLESHNVDVVVGSVVNVMTRADTEPHMTNMGPARVMGAGIFAREVFEKVGLLPEDGRIHEVFDWWSRAQNLITVHRADQIALYRHIHGDNMTLQPQQQGRVDLLARIRDHVKRRDSTRTD